MENDQQTMQQNEDAALKRLAELEDLAEKKAGIFSRLLTDITLAKEMETLAEHHEQRKNALCALLGERGKEK